MGNLEENQNNEKIQTKKYKVNSYEKFKNALEKFARKVYDENTENQVPFDLEGTLQNELNYTAEHIKNWILGNTYPPSNVLELFINKYKEKIECNNLEYIGIGEVEESNGEEEFTKRLKGLMDEYGLREIDLARKLCISKSIISKWCSGKRTPTISQLKKIAQLFGVHYLYLLGEIETRDVSSSMINEQIGINDIAINTIKFYNQINKYGKKFHEHIKNHYGFDYIDIVNYIVSDLELFNIFYLEAINVLTYHQPKSILKEEFDSLLNSLELNLTDEEIKSSNGTTQVQTPYIKTHDLLSKAVLQKKIEIMFDDFIKDKSQK